MYHDDPDVLENANDVVLAPRFLHASESFPPVNNAGGRLYRLGGEDALTGLLDRYSFLETLLRTLDVWKGGSGVAATAVVRLFPADRSHGMDERKAADFPLPDALIQLAAQRLQREFADDAIEGDTLLARTASDTFALCVRMEDAGDVYRCADRISEKFSTPFVLDKMRHAIGFRIGICLHAFDPDSGIGFLARAEHALRDAQKRGDRFRLISSPADFAAGLRRAEQDALRYRPYVDLRNGCVCGIEAVPYEDRARHSLFSADHYFSWERQNNGSIETGWRTIAEACAQARRWEQLGFGPLSVSIKVPATQFERMEFSGEIARALAETEIDPRRLELEMTGATTIRDEQTATTTLWLLRDLGVRIALEDLGSGYDFFHYLRQYPVDILKIDRALTGAIGVDPLAEAIVRGMIALARILNLSIVAEGVRTPEQAEFLRIQGCERARGDYFGMAAEAASAPDLFFRRDTAVRESLM